MRPTRRIGKRLLLFLWLCVLAAFAPVPLSAAPVATTAAPAIQARCGRGMLLDVAGRRVLLLAGTPYQMGYQQGRLLSDEIKTLVQTVLTVSQAGFDPATGGLEGAWRRCRPFIEPRHLQEMEGLADGAGIELVKVQRANVFPELFHCSGFALFGRATQQGRLLHGRILDYMTEAGLQNQAVITVARPQGRHGFISVGYAGFLGSVTGMNEKQIAIGEMGGRGEGHWDGMPMSFLVRLALEQADTLSEAVEIFRRTPRTCEYYYVISDGKIPDARALACTPDQFELLKPGQSHPLLPHGMPDTVLVSGDDRYEHLARLVRQQYGSIDLDAALDLMNRPVAMESCLHRVLFVPAEGKLLAADAAEATGERYAACYQPYYPYDLGQLLAMIPQETPAGVESIPARPANPAAGEPSDAPAGEPNGIAGEPAGKKRRWSGMVPAASIRPLPPAGDPRQQELLQTYPISNEAFSYQVLWRRNTLGYDVYEIRFPSPVLGTVAENNTVYCEYYHKEDSQRHPVVILLDILDGSLKVPRVLAHALADAGIDACIMIMPHYGARRSADERQLQGLLSSPARLIDSVRQAVLDIRRTARCLANLELVDSRRIGLCGVSMGGFVAALAAGIDGGFDRVAVLLAGGDLAGALTTNAREVESIQEVLVEHGLTGEALEEILAPIEPLRFADRLRSCNVLMINGSTDTIVPPACATKLAEAAGARICWFPADHYDMIKYLLPALSLVRGHFSPENWSEKDESALKTP
ncbi:MAG: prolyl oligopeptidase family serine peptidase [Sedimentisphaerales bacterium]|nr:prolyl oligopeptidase family serine peptidase [Sedimentisphaerales bacterium]